MVATSEITQDRGTLPRTGTVGAGIVPSPPENAWYVGASCRITSLLSNAGEGIYQAQERDSRRTTIVVASVALYYSGIDPRSLSHILPVSGSDWSLVGSISGYPLLERGSTGGLLDRTCHILPTQFQAQSTLFSITDCLSPSRVWLLGSHAGGQTAKTLKCAFALPLPSVETTADLLSRVRAHLSLNTTELAQSLRIERATIYGWMKGSHTPRSEHRQRLTTLAHLAETWTRLYHEPLQDLKHALIEGSSTLLDLLSAPDLNEIQIKRVLAKLADRRKTDAESKTAEAEKSIHEIARERGWEPVDPEIREQTIRGLSFGRGG